MQEKKEHWWSDWFILDFLCSLCLFACDGCTVEPTSTQEYCFADYQCSWYDYNGSLVTEWLCEDEITDNMTCR